MDGRHDNGCDIGAAYGRFEAALDQVTRERYIDTGHVFAFGHSLGAQFIAHMLGDSRTRETLFAGVVEVASSASKTGPGHRYPPS